MKVMFFLVFSMFFHFSAIAAPERTPSSVPGELHIYNEAGSTYVDLVPTGCSGKRYYIPPSHQKYDGMISILLAAQLAGREVQGRFDGCNQINQGKLIGVYLK